MWSDRRQRIRKSANKREFQRTTNVQASKRKTKTTDKEIPKILRSYYIIFAFAFTKRADSSGDKTFSPVLFLNLHFIYSPRTKAAKKLYFFFYNTAIFIETIVLSTTDKFPTFVLYAVHSVLWMLTNNNVCKEDKNGNQRTIKYC